MSRILRWLAVLAAITVAACSGVREAGSGANAPPTAAEAARFLTQTTYGPTDATINEVRTSGYSRWIDQQMVLPAPTHIADLESIAAPTTQDFYPSYWRQAISSPDQLRQRMKLALSEIFVISITDNSIGTRGAASYYDMLGANAFGNFRTLLEQVTLHPMMGIYLTYLGNQKEDPATPPPPPAASPTKTTPARSCS